MMTMIREPPFVYFAGEQVHLFVISAQSSLVCVPWILTCMCLHRRDTVRYRSITAFECLPGDLFALIFVEASHLSSTTDVMD
jgi:hypothetical protein